MSEYQNEGGIYGTQWTTSSRKRTLFCLRAHDIYANCIFFRSLPSSLDFSPRYRTVNLFQSTNHFSTLLMLFEVFRRFSACCDIWIANNPFDLLRLYILLLVCLHPQAPHFIFHISIEFNSVCCCCCISQLPRITRSIASDECTGGTFLCYLRRVPISCTDYLSITFASFPLANDVLVSRQGPIFCFPQSIRPISSSFLRCLQHYAVAPRGDDWHIGVWVVAVVSPRLASCPVGGRRSQKHVKTNKKSKEVIWL